MAIALIYRVIIVVACFVSSSALAQQAVGLRTDILLASPAMAINDIDSSWQAPSTGDYAQARARVETYFTANAQWSFGVEKRWHYLLGFSEDTAQFYSRLENNAIYRYQSMRLLLVVFLLNTLYRYLLIGHFYLQGIF